MSEFSQIQCKVEFLEIKLSAPLGRFYRQRRIMELRLGLTEDKRLERRLNTVQVTCMIVQYTHQMENKVELCAYVTVIRRCNITKWTAEAQKPCCVRVDVCEGSGFICVMGVHLCRRLKEAPSLATSLLRKQRLSSVKV